MTKGCSTVTGRYRLQRAHQRDIAAVAPAAMAKSPDGMGRAEQAAPDAPQKQGDQCADQNHQDQNAGRGFKQPAVPFDRYRSMLFCKPNGAQDQNGQLGKEPQPAYHLAPDAGAAGA
jgi:hypothetical protein